MKEITLNGDLHKTESANYHSLINSLQINPEKIILLVNGNVIKFENFLKTEIVCNDKVELVSLVGGG